MPRNGGVTTPLSTTNRPVVAPVGPFPLVSVGGPTTTARALGFAVLRWSNAGVRAYGQRRTSARASPQCLRKDSSPSSPYFAGTLDDAAYYTTTLTAAQASSLYQARI